MMLIVCNLVDPLEASFMSRRRIEMFGAACARLLASARAEGRLISHMGSSAQRSLPVLPHCRAMAFEPVFSETDSSLLQHQGLLTRIEQSCDGRAELIGLIDGALLRSTLYHAERLGIDLRINSGASHIFEMVQIDREGRRA